MKTRFTLIIFLFISFLLQSNAQDMIVKRNQEVINCLVLSVDEHEIKYRFTGHPNDSVFTIEKVLLSKVVFSNNTQVVFFEDGVEVDPMKQKPNALKFEFLSPVSGNLTFAYEYTLNQTQSIETALGIIGLGVYNPRKEAFGAFTKAGYKFVISPNQYLSGLKHVHRHHGMYLKPEFMFGYYSARMTYWYDVIVANEYGTYYDYREKDEVVSVFSAALQLVAGMQWVIDNTLLIDAYAGLGYGFSSYSKDTNKYEYDMMGYHYGYTVGDHIPVSISLGLKLGIPSR